MSDSYTIKGRLVQARHALVLLNAGVLALGTEDDGSSDISREDLIDALVATASTVGEHLYWLSLLPESVLTAPSPDDDDASTPEDKRQMVEGVLVKVLAESALNHAVQEATPKAAKRGKR